MAWEFPGEHLDIGDVVHYRRRPGHPEVHMMYVHNIGENSIEGPIMFTNGAESRGALKTGVRHADDPDLCDPATAQAVLGDDDSGVFDLHPKTKRLIELERAVAKLTPRPPGRPRKTTESEEAKGMAIVEEGLRERAHAS